MRGQTHLTALRPPREMTGHAVGGLPDPGPELVHRRRHHNPKPVRSAVDRSGGRIRSVLLARRPHKTIPDPVARKGFTETDRRVLDPCRCDESTCHRVTRQLVGHRRSDRPAQDVLGEHVDDEGGVGPAGPGRNVGDVGDPDLIGVVADRGAFPLAATQPVQAFLTTISTLAPSVLRVFMKMHC